MGLAKAFPLKTVRLSSIYDAAATNNEADFGHPLRGYEDYHFNGIVRSLTIGRFRRESRNNPFLAGLVEEFPGAIGSPEMRTRTPDNNYNAVADLFFRRWGKMITLERDSFHTVVEVFWREMLTTGEFFATLLANGKIQMIPSELCGSGTALGETPPDAAGRYERNGVVYSAQGIPVAYRFGKMGPGGLVDFSDSTEVPARYVIHTWRRDRVSMGRGLPWLLASLKPARDLYEICRSKTKQIKDANQITGAIEKTDASDWLTQNQGLPAGAAALASASGDEAADSSPDNEEPIVVELKNGTFIALEPGEKLHQIMSEYKAEDYKELIFIMLHMISAPTGLPAELWFSGLGDVSYSGYKGLGTLWVGRRKRYQRFARENLLDRLHDWRMAKAAKEGDIPNHPTGDIDQWEYRWREPQVLDDEKTAKGNQTRLASGEISLEDLWEERGYSADEVFAKRRASYIRLLRASGQLSEVARDDDVEVPLSFLLRGELPGAPPEEEIPERDTEDPEEDPEDPAR